MEPQDGHSPDALVTLLRSVWGHGAFRPLQKEAIEAALSGRDCFVLMSTGSGKSVCYQLPATFARQGKSPGPVTVVISPLVSLMEDQVLSLKRAGIAACVIGSGTAAEVERAALRGEFALIFTTPEKLEYWGGGLERLQRDFGILMFAVDESHSISEWGHDFRPEYAKLGHLRDSFPDVPIVALTATATPRVQLEIISKLRLRSPLVAKTSFNRPNLHYSVRQRGRAAETAIELRRLINGAGPAIVYCPTRKSTEEVAAAISSQGPGLAGAQPIRCGAYHAGMPAAARRDVHERFLRDELQVVVATVAFGMGIDKPDCRLVVHHGMPKTVESYYQQTGRAGRDGLQARCVLLFSRADRVTLSNIMGKRADGEPTNPEQAQRDSRMLSVMEGYATTLECRRATLLRYFGEELAAPCTGCDNCERPAGSGPAALTSEALAELSGRARLVLRAVRDSGGRRGMSACVALLLGTAKARAQSGNASKPSFGKGKGVPESFWKALFHHLHERERLLSAHEVSWTDGNGRGCSGTTFGLSLEGTAFLENEEALLPAATAPSQELRKEMSALLAKAAAAARRAAESIAGRNNGWRAADAFAGAPSGSGASFSSYAYPPSPSGADRSLLALGSALQNEETLVYDELFKLRSQLAEQLGETPYNIINSQALNALAQQRPVDLAALRAVGGLGEKRIADYGQDIVAAVRRVCEAHGIATNVDVPAAADGGGGSGSGGVEPGWLQVRRPGAAELKPLTQSEIESYAGYVRGGTLEEIAASHARSPSIKTVRRHLAKCLEAGRPLLWDRRRLGISADTEAAIKDAIGTLQARRGLDPLASDYRMKPVFEALPEGTSTNVYDDIALVLARVRHEAGGTRLREVDSGGGSGGSAYAAGGSSSTGGSGGSAYAAGGSSSSGGSGGSSTAMFALPGYLSQKGGGGGSGCGGGGGDSSGSKRPLPAARNGSLIGSPGKVQKLAIPACLHPSPSAAPVGCGGSPRAVAGAVTPQVATSPYAATTAPAVTVSTPPLSSAAAAAAAAAFNPPNDVAAVAAAPSNAPAATAADSSALFAFIERCSGGGGGDAGDIMARWAAPLGLSKAIVDGLLAELQGDGVIYQTGKGSYAVL